MADTNDSKGQTIGWAAGAAAAMPVLDSIVNGLFQSNINKKKMEFDKEEARKQRVFSEMMWQKQADWDLDMWNKSNEYNTASEQVKRLREAGLNPLYYGVDGVAAQPMSAPQAMGYDRASAANITNPYNGGLMNVMSSLKDVQLKDAQIDKLKEDTTGVQLDNEFKEKTMKARVEAQDLANAVTKSQNEKYQAEKDQIRENIKKTQAETNNEILKGLLIQADTNLKNIQAYEVQYLMTYKKLLMEAQTTAQRATAAAQYLKAAIDQKLLDGGQVDALIDKAKAEARDADARAAMDEFKSAIHNGTYFNPDTFNTLAGKAGAKFLNSLFAAVSGLSEAVVGPAASIFK